MGSQTFGKGSVQTVAKIDKHNGVKLTVAQYMTPKDRKIQAIGIVPDIKLDEADATWITSHKKENQHEKNIHIIFKTIDTQREAI